ncbi:hypothetical protein [Psychrobacillus vulpis]|uniref:Lipoprotein n=1 Tax=Psychrobacillus vulpis TaxID=2325572 RepID=A0A544TD87_9BACI|nr:hypothetical protein [Psychrobacillus vulpis]TQR15411.1 hypothetical protein FG384_19360 [Psychrobacillus vulpis]
MISVKKLTLATIFLVFLLLFSCQANENDLMFVGEGENWSSKVTVNQTNGDETYQIQINYKGYSIQKIDTFSYYVEAKNNGVVDFGGNKAFLNKEGIYQSDLPISNSPSTSVKDELVIKVEWNGKSESFTLINN